MKNRILLITVVLLGALLILENAYLLGLKHGEKRHKAFSSHYRIKTDPRQGDIREMPNIFPGFLSPLEEARLLKERIDRRIKEELAQNLFNRPAQDRGLNIIYSGSKIEFNETEGAYLMKVNLPGLKPEDIKVEIKDRQLTVSNQKEQSSPDQANYSYSRFSSSFLLPEDAEVNQLKSDYRNGILIITVPREKAQDAKGQVKIPAR